MNKKQKSPFFGLLNNDNSIFQFWRWVIQVEGFLLFALVQQQDEGKSCRPDLILQNIHAQRSDLVVLEKPEEDVLVDWVPEAFDDYFKLFLVVYGVLVLLLSPRDIFFVLPEILQVLLAADHS